MTTTHRRPSRLRRSWLFLAGADHDALVEGAASGADVLIQELETFTPPDRRPAARELSERVLAGWREAGILASVRVNPLDAGGIDDLRAAMRGRPDIVMMSYVATPEQVVALAHEGVERPELPAWVTAWAEATEIRSAQAVPLAGADEPVVVAADEPLVDTADDAEVPAPVG